jgi:uncharacterized membrane protein
VKRVCVLVCTCLLLLSTAIMPSVALAAESTPPGVLDIAVLYPKLNGLITDTFTFEVGLKNLTDKALNCALTVTGPNMWSIYMTPQADTTKKISAVRLSPTGEYDFVEYIEVMVTPPADAIIDPGDYPIVFTADSGNATISTQLTAVITGSYSLKVVPVNGLYNTTATAGKGSIFSLDIQNLGTAPVTAIDFFSDKTEGWLVGVSIAGIDKLRAGADQVVDLTIIPPANSIPGDYYFSFWAKGVEGAGSADIRVTVESPTMWGWIGLIIIILILAGMVYLYVAFRRR